VGGLGPNWLIPDPTGIESVFIDFKVLYWNNKGDVCQYPKNWGVWGEAWGPGPRALP